MPWLYPYRQRDKYVIPASKIDSDLTDFPVTIFTANVQVGNDKKLAVTTADGRTQCKVEVESSNSRRAILNSKIPSVSSSVNTTIYLYHDPLVADNSTYVGYVNSSVGAEVWDANYVLVDHMQDYGDTSHTVDSTSNNNDGTKSGAATPAETTGLIGYAQNFSTGNHEINQTVSASLQVDDTDKVTMEAFVNLSSIDNAQRPIIDCSRDPPGAPVRQGYYLSFVNKKILAACWKDGVQKHNYGGTVLGAGDLNKWLYIVAVCDSRYVECFLNGVSDGATDYTAYEIGAQIIDMQIGAYDTFAYFPDLIDEIRISDTDRSDAWIKASYYSGTNQLLTYDYTETHEAIIPKLSPAPTPPASVSSMFKLKDWLESKIAE